MYLEEIEIIGFKSFANKTILKFPKPSTRNKGITAIVGPNGSGKSNVADALRWALGESSAKTLRGKLRDDVIFSGSAKKNRMNFAEVTLRIKNQDKISNIDLSEIEITRRIFRNGDSEFLLNKNKTRKEDILMLLAKASFGQKTYAVIGQGMADSVLSASLQERKTFFEEAAGVTQYQLKKHQILNRFDATRENLGQTELTIKELEPRLKSLSRQVSKLKQRDEIEKDLKLIQRAYYNLIYRKHNDLITQSEERKLNLNNNIIKLEKDIKEVQTQMNNLYKGDSRQAVFENLQKDYNSAIQERNNLLREEALISAKKDAEYQKGGQSNLVWLNNKKSEIDEFINENTRKVLMLKKEILTLKNEEDNQLSIINGTEKRIILIKEDLQKIKESNLTNFNEENDLQEILEMQNSLLEDLMNIKDLNKIEEIRNQAKAINAKLAVYLETLHSIKQSQVFDINNLQEQLEKSIEEKNNLNIILSKIKLDASSKFQRIEDLQNSIREKEIEKEKINNEIKIVSTQSNRSELLEEIESQLIKIKTKEAIKNKEIEKFEAKIEKFNESEEEKKEQIKLLQIQSNQKQNELNIVTNEMNLINIDVVKHSIRLEDLEREIIEESLNLEDVVSLELNKQLDVLNYNKDEAHEKIHQLKKQLEIIGGIDQETLNEYDDIKKRYDFLIVQAGDLESAIVSMEKIIEELDATIKTQFDKSFKEINAEFQKYFKILFDGGKAELSKVSLLEEREKEDNEGEERTTKQKDSILASVDKITKKIRDREKESFGGIEIKAEPPGKKINSINMLSGGERALTSIALISAIIANNNSPFVMLDEMDAALDESNAHRFAEILKELSNTTQFIVITHTRATMTESQLIYGVTMDDSGVSKLLSIELEQAEEMDVMRH